MWSKIDIKPSGNKSRFGYRGKKLRYAVFKAQWNQKWLPVEERQCRRLCEEYDIEPEVFLSEDDNPNRKWSYALIRAERILRKRAKPYPNILNSGKSPFYRY